jgi:hypothetical protein
MIEQIPKRYRAAVDAENAEQWTEAYGQEMASMESHEIFTFVEKVPEGASMIGSCWVMGRQLMAKGTIDKWKVGHVGCGDLQKHGDNHDITSPVIDSASIRLALSHSVKHHLEIAILDIPTAFLCCPLHQTLYMRLPQGETPDAYGLARPLVKLNKSLYSLKHANWEYYKAVFDFIVDDLILQASIAAPRLFFSGNLGEAHGFLIPVYFDDILSMCRCVHFASIESRRYDRFMAAGKVPVHYTFQYRGLTVTRDRNK